MKRLIQITLSVLLSTSWGLAQDFQGKAIYKTIRQMDLTLEGNMDPAMQERIKTMMQKQMNSEHELVFDQYQSTYNKVEELDADAGNAGGGMMVMAFSSGEGSVLYKNTAENRYSSVRDLFGKEFLVKDEIEKLDWKLEKETKQIGEYTCYKATYEREQRNFKRVVIDNDEDDAVEEESTETITVTAWYTPDIPVAHGPATYSGLPGLIMEVQDGRTTTICTQITLNPSDRITIEEPKGGKIVTEEEFEKLMEEKMAEMEKMNRGGKRGQDGHSVEIRIGG